MQAITVDDVPVGIVSSYWECKETRWLEAGVVIYDSDYWGKGIASAALPKWITHLFSAFEIERVGLTTWSGNPRMMACALKLGFKQEACLRKVRYHQGKYYDSVKYGVLRSEWEQLSKQ
jgi:RimJ/RimL family protein N-acetyltransferase